MSGGGKRDMRGAVLRTMDPTRREHFVYRAYDAEGVLLYVGCSRNLKKRWSEHRGWSAWAPRAARFRVSGPYAYTVARRLEREAIKTEDPLHNANTPRNLALKAEAESLARRAQALRRQA